MSEQCMAVFGIGVSIVAGVLAARLLVGHVIKVISVSFDEPEK